MTLLERLTGRVRLRTGIILFGAMTGLALSSTFAGRAGVLGLGATAVGAASGESVAPENNDTAIRPFRVTIPEKELVELRRRISATRWPTSELVKDQHGESKRPFFDADGRVELAEYVADRQPIAVQWASSSYRPCRAVKGWTSTLRPDYRLTRPFHG